MLSQHLYLAANTRCRRSTTVFSKLDRGSFECSRADKYIVPLPNTAIFIVMALSWGWLSDGPLKGARWPFIYAGAIITVSIGEIEWTVC
jgi:hypothetical protein